MAMLACAGAGTLPPLVHRDAAASMGGARRVALLVDVTVRTTSMYGGAYDSAGQADSLRRRLLELVGAALGRRGLEAAPAATRDDLEEVRLLFRAVVADHEWMASADGPPDWRPPLAYQVGDIRSILEQAGADHLLVAWMHLHVDAFVPQLEGGFLLFGLIDRDGRLLWLSRERRTYAGLTSDPREQRRLIDDMLIELPGATP